jgi:nucleotide-binding universal stress UspA family protein
MYLLRVDEGGHGGIANGAGYDDSDLSVRCDQSPRAGTTGHNAGRKSATPAAAHAHCASHAQLGHAAEAIIELADRLQCDHIVMATHGRGALADLLLGSTTVRVVHLAHMPVVLVK